MSNTIRQKRGTSDPSASDFSQTAELLVNTTDGGLFTKTDGGSVVEIGAGLSNNSSQNESLGIGTNALDSQTTETYSVGIGYEALTANTTGESNVALGYRALKSTTTGGSNVSVGLSSLRENTTGNNNTSAGSQSLQSNTTGSNNTAHGYKALFANTTGSNNVASGYQALKNNTTGLYNVAIGRDALLTNSTGHWNIGMGWEALKSSTVSYNIGIGYQAGDAVTTGAENVLIGKSAGGAMTTGESNVCIGKEAGDNLTTGSFNIVIGRDATASSASVSNELTLGSTNINSLRIPGLQSGASNGQVLTYNSSNGNIDLAAPSIVLDTTPQLGGDLDMNSKFISSGVLGIKNEGAQSELRLYCEASNAHYAAIKAPPHSGFSGDITFTLPGADGSANQVLKTDGSGNFGWANQTAAYTNSDVDTHLNQSNPTSGYVLSWNGSDYAWVAQSGGGGSTSPGGSNTQIQFNNSGSFGGSSNLTFDGTNLTCAGTISAVSPASSAAGLRKITTSTASPSGGSDGDLWIKYTA